MLWCFCQIRNQFDSNCELHVNKTAIFGYWPDICHFSNSIACACARMMQYLFQWYKKLKQSNKSEKLEAFNSLQRQVLKVHFFWGGRCWFRYYTSAKFVIEHHINFVVYFVFFSSKEDLFIWNLWFQNPFISLNNNVN